MQAPTGRLLRKRIGGPVGAYIVRRLLISIPVLLGITIIGFIALKSAPGDPLLVSANPEVLGNSPPTPRSSRRNATAGPRPADLPEPVRELAGRRPPGRPRLLAHLTSGPIAYEIGTRIPQTLFLMVTALSLAVLRWASRSG